MAGKIIAVAMVKNETDIIEAFVRHNLAFVDCLHLLDHASSDTTVKIVDRLIEEGLPVTVKTENDFVLNKQVIVNANIGRVIELEKPDFVVPLDADEFIAASSRQEFEEELARIPARGGLQVSWVTYVPTEHDDPGEINALLRIRYRRLLPKRELKKCFFRADAVTDGGAVLADGQHTLINPDGSAAPLVVARNLKLAHFPVRSADQIASKSMVGWLARRVSEDFVAGASSPGWERLNISGALRRSATELRKLGERYQTRAEPADVPVVERPFQTAAVRLRYADLIEVDPVYRIFRQAEAMAERLGQVAGVVKRDGIDQDRINRIIEQQARATRDARHSREARRRSQQRQGLLLAALVVALAGLVFDLLR